MEPVGPLKPVTPVITRLDEAIADAIDAKTKPLGALGQLEALAATLARVQQSLKPRMRNCRLIIFAADHGVVQEGVSVYPQSVTAQMVMNFIAGGAAANIFAATNGVELAVVNAGVAGEPLSHPNLINRSIAAGTRNFLQEPAMTAAQLDAALQAGFALGQQGSADVFAGGDMGIGNTSSATLLAHKLLVMPLGPLTGRGTGLDDAGLKNKLDLLTRAAARTASSLPAHAALCEYGGFEIAMMAGAMLGAASSRKVVLVDGFIASAAALCAVRLDGALRDYLVFAHRSAEGGHGAILDALDAHPLLDLSMRLGEGTGALLAWPLLQCAAAMLCDMASFDTAGVSGPA